MGIYNCGSTLSDAIESILHQTYEDWELIMCDDGSTDNTYKIADEYRLMYPEKIILIKNENNLGLNRTLNNCLAVASGDYIARMDGDDLSKPNRFEVEIEYLINHPDIAIVSTPMEYFDENGVFAIGKGGYTPEKKHFPKGSPICHAPCMVRKEAYLAVGGYSVEKRLLRVEDYHLWIKMYAKGYKAYILPMPLYMMRDDKDAYKRRTLRNYINVSYCSRLAVKMLHLPFYYYIYSIKPIITWIAPSWIYKIIHKKKIGRISVPNNS